ncbi:hypothetical protein [Nesterenkonia rhizosphaerae]|uniref:Uncharacterized protein n=1 Tax=Nesterenkonia rhizosphaerae TaxID=1348272 RepID=A0ABP9FUB1_9MICC
MTKHPEQRPAVIAQRLTLTWDASPVQYTDDKQGELAKAVNEGRISLRRALAKGYQVGQGIK